jgi:hypothetical protein
MPYILNGQQVTLGREPVVRQGRNFVPLEDMVTKLGGTLSWDHDTKTAHATIGQWTAHVQADNPQVQVNTQQVSLTDPPYIEDGTMFVPWTFFRDAYGYKVDMEADTLVVSL